MHGLQKQNSGGNNFRRKLLVSIFIKQTKKHWAASYITFFFLKKKEKGKDSWLRDIHYCKHPWLFFSTITGPVQSLQHYQSKDSIMGVHLGVSSNFSPDDLKQICSYNLQHIIEIELINNNII